MRDDFFSSQPSRLFLFGFRSDLSTRCVTDDKCRWAHAALYISSTMYLILMAKKRARGQCNKLSCDLLGRVSLVPVGTPAYIQEISRGRTLDWSRATLIHTSSANEDWETWCNQSQTDISAARKLVLGTAQLSLEAAAGGLGIAMGRTPLVDDDVAAGRLAIAVDRWLLVGQAARHRNAPRDRCLPKLAPQGNVAVELESPFRPSSQSRVVTATFLASRLWNEDGPALTAEGSFSNGCRLVPFPPRGCAAAAAT
jgi:LysR substrate binding domain